MYNKPKVELVLCAAIWYKEQSNSRFLPENIKEGVVVCGYRHPHCMHAFISLTGLRSVEPECGKYVQGFLTNRNRFLNRKEAAELVLSTGQIKELHFSDELYSEDLY